MVLLYGTRTTALSRFSASSLPLAIAVVPMLMVNVRIMRVAVPQQRVSVLMGVRLSPIPLEWMGVLVILVMNVVVRMR